MLKQEKNPRLKDHKKTRIILSIIGGLMMAGGIVMVVIGALNHADFDTGLFALIPVGAFSIMIGLILIWVSNMGAIMRFFAGQAVPVAGDATADFFEGEGGKAIKSTIREIRDDQPTKKTKFCPYCGETINSDAVFCEHCGKRL